MRIISGNREYNRYSTNYDDCLINLYGKNIVGHSHGQQMILGVYETHERALQVYLELIDNDVHNAHVYYMPEV